MGKIHLLDCTLRDGGYVNDWQFGEQSIKGFCKKIAETGIEYVEVGFLKGNEYNPDRAVFPTVESYKNVITPKSDNIKYVGMLDMSAPVELESIPAYDGSSIDGIRIIFKKDKLDEAYGYCKRIQELGYFISVNFVGTDAYSDDEFIRGIEKFNTLNPFAVSIVDSFGLIKRKHFLRLVYLADNNLKPEITLAYHAHNNLQQAFGNAEALVEMNLKRDILIDACVFGMGRGAGNLNLELFAEYMNENYDTSYNIDPMLEIMDEYLSDIYKEKFWGYSLPLYLSATIGCHPNYAIYLAEKDSLSAKDFKELLESIPTDDRSKFSKEKANEYYRKYLDKEYDDTDTRNRLQLEFADKNILMIAPGRSVLENIAKIKSISEKADTISVAINFVPEEIGVDYVFSNNMKRYGKFKDSINCKRIITSNLDDESCENKIDYKKYACSTPEIMDNSGLMFLNFLNSLGVKKVYIAGLDGYSQYYGKDYYNQKLEYAFSSKAEDRNALISDELKQIASKLEMEFITPTNYKLD